jgi:hypothetical protein
MDVVILEINEFEFEFELFRLRFQHS